MAQETVEHAEGVRLLEDEEVLHNVRASWSRWWKSLLFGTLLLLVLIGVVLLLKAWLQRRHTRYLVTNQRVIETTGTFSSSTTEYRISDIQQLQTGASFFESLTGKGNIQFGTGRQTITMAGVPNYKTIANTIREQQRKKE